MRYEGVLLLFVLICQSAVPAGAESLFGPARGYVMAPGELPYPGHSELSPVYFQQVTWFQGTDTGMHQSVCIVGLDGYGSQIPDLFTEIPSSLAFNVFYGRWLSGGGFRFAPDSPPACLSLLPAGTCVWVTGRHLDIPDVFGRSTVVDGMTTCN